MKLVLSPAAIHDLQSIAIYTRQTWGAEQEAHYVSGLWKKLEAIQAQPDTFRQRNDLSQGCRSARYEMHVIFFAVGDDALQVIRILHGAMDFNRHFPEDVI